MKTFNKWLENLSQGWELFHGSNSEEFVGQIRANERDSGWFGSGFYLSAIPSYAKRWGKNVHKMIVPFGKFAKIQVIGNYKEILFGDAEFANQEAGGQEAFNDNEHLWSKKFTEALKKQGYDGVRVNFDEHKDVEVVIFDPSKIQVLGKI
jgi:hypothetical protein